MQSGTTFTLPRDIDADLDRWLEPFLDVTGRSTRRKMAPLYVRGLLGSGGRKSVQPMAERLGLASHDPLHHFISSRSEEHTSELQSHVNLVCRLLLEKKKKKKKNPQLVKKSLT